MGRPRRPASDSAPSGAGSWRDLLQQGGETITVPWTGGRLVRSGGRSFDVNGRLPPEHGFHEFTITGG